jgi:hypothetical protein
LNFDLDPGDALFEQVIETALRLRETLQAAGMQPHSLPARDWNSKWLEALGAGA